MYQRRINLWAWSFAIYFAFSFLCGLIFKDKNEIIAYVDADSVVKEQISEMANLTDIKENANMIISSDPELNEPGFEKIEGSIYSPVVCYCPDSFDKSGYLYQSGTSTRYINMKSIIEAVVQSDEDDLTINVFLPSEGTILYDEAIEQIYVSLNNMQVPNDNEREQLRPTVEKFLERTNVCNDVRKYISSNDTIKDNSLFIGGEYILDSYYLGNQNYLGYFPAYFEKSKVIECYVYATPESKKNVINLLESKSFAKKTYLRTAYYSKYKKIFHIGLSPNGINIVR